MKVKVSKKTVAKATIGKSTAKGKGASALPVKPARSKRSSGAVMADMTNRTPTNSAHYISKKAMIEGLVRRKEGAVIADLVASTGWQEHSIRAALTGLRKAGHAILRERDDGGTTRYRIAAVA